MSGPTWCLISSCLALPHQIDRPDCAAASIPDSPFAHASLCSALQRCPTAATSRLRARKSLQRAGICSAQVFCSAQVGCSAQESPFSVSQEAGVGAATLTPETLARAFPSGRYKRSADPRRLWGLWGFATFVHKARRPLGSTGRPSSQLLALHPACCSSPATSARPRPLSPSFPPPSSLARPLRCAAHRSGPHHYKPTPRLAFRACRRPRPCVASPPACSCVDRTLMRSPPGAQYHRFESSMLAR